jgi:oligoendopeptidase F
MVQERKDVSKEDCWNVEALFPTLNDWKSAYKNMFHTNEPTHWPEISSYKDKLGEGAETVKACLELITSIDRRLAALYTYAHLRHDEEITLDDHKAAYNQITALIQDFHQEVSWFEPQLLALPEQTIHAYLSSPILAPYRFHLEKIFRMKKHTLSQEKEELMALAGKALTCAPNAFRALSDADLKFGTVKDGKGMEHELTHAVFALYIREQDRTLRENAFKTYQNKYQEFENTLAELINGEVQKHVFQARARHFGTSLEAALYPKNIDPSVYHSLIQAAHEEIGSLHKYIALRKKMLKLDPLHLYDMYVPLTADVDIRMSYKDAEAIVIESVAPLGSEYQNLLKKGLQEQRWVDRYENKNKRSGGYSSGCYDSMPYILLNYKELLRDVFTLAHEGGHSMHSLLSNTHQPYHYSDYSIFLAEVASTFNEELLIRLMLQRAKTTEEKIFLLNQKIDDIRLTLFRQTMFAEFELKIHTLAEQNVPLTPRLLKEEYRKLNQFYFGPDVIVDPQADIEWARIPHFYYNFYVFQYATGISAALALSERVLKGGHQEREQYLSFLKGGSSRYPIEMLDLAGVDMRTPTPVKAAIQKFSNLVKEMEKLITEQEKLAVTSHKC